MDQEIGIGEAAQESHRLHEMRQLLKDRLQETEQDKGRKELERDVQTLRRGEIRGIKDVEGLYRKAEGKRPFRDPKPDHPQIHPGDEIEDLDREIDEGRDIRIGCHGVGKYCHEQVDDGSDPHQMRLPDHAPAKERKEQRIASRSLKKSI